MFEPSTNAKLFVSDSYLTDNGIGHVAGGIYIQPASGVTATVAISNSRIENNQFGIIADGNAGGIISGTVSNSQITGNIGNGITASTTSSNVVLFIDNTAASGNLNGLVAGGSTAALMVSNTTVSGNATGLGSARGGQLFSYGNNRVDGNNGNNGAFTGPATLK